MPMKAFATKLDDKESVVYLFSTPHPTQPNKKIVLPFSYIPTPEQTRTQHIHFLLDVSGSMGKHDFAGGIQTDDDSDDDSDDDNEAKVLPPSSLFLALNTINSIIAQFPPSTQISLTPFDSVVHQYGFYGKEKNEFTDDMLKQLFNQNQYGGGTAIYDAIATLKPLPCIEPGHNTIFIITDGADGNSRLKMEDAIRILKLNFTEKLPSLVVVGIGTSCDVPKLHTIARLSNTQEIVVKSADELQTEDTLNKIFPQIAYGQHVMFHFSENCKSTSQIAPYNQLTPSEAFCLDASVTDQSIVENLMGATNIEEIDASQVPLIPELQHRQIESTIYGAYLKDEGSRIYEAPMPTVGSETNMDRRERYVQQQQLPQRIESELARRISTIRELQAGFQRVTVAPFGNESIHTYLHVLQDKLLNSFKINVYEAVSAYGTEPSHEEQLAALHKGGREVVVPAADRNNAVKAIKDLYPRALANITNLNITEADLERVTKDVIQRIMTGQRVSIPNGIGQTCSIARGGSTPRDLSAVQLSDATYATPSYFSKDSTTSLTSFASNVSSYRSNPSSFVPSTGYNQPSFRPSSSGHNQPSFSLSGNPNQSSSSSSGSASNHSQPQSTVLPTTQQALSQQPRQAQPSNQNLDAKRVDELLEQIKCIAKHHNQKYIRAPQQIVQRSSALFPNIRRFFAHASSISNLNEPIELPLLAENRLEKKSISALLNLLENPLERPIHQGHFNGLCLGLLGGELHQLAKNNSAWLFNGLVVDEDPKIAIPGMINRLISFKRLVSETSQVQRSDSLDSQSSSSSSISAFFVAPPAIKPAEESTHGNVPKG